MKQLHHAGLCPADIEASLRFYVEGIGLEVLFDVVLDMDLEGLLGERTEHVRTIFLGDPANPEVGILELIDLGTGRIIDQPPAAGGPSRGVFLISFHVPVNETLARLADLGFGGRPRRIPSGPDSWAATVVDPDGVMVELLDKSPSLGTPSR